MDDRTVGQAVTPTLKALDSFLSVVDSAKETSMPLKGTVWNAAEEAVPGLSEVESRARDLRGELREWDEESRRLNESLRRLESEVETGPDGEVDYEAVTELFSDAMDSMQSLDEKSESLEKRLKEVSERSSEVAIKAAEIPVLGERIRDRLEKLSSRLSQTADEVREVNRNPDDVIEVYPRGQD